MSNEKPGDGNGPVPGTCRKTVPHARASGPRPSTPPGNKNWSRSRSIWPFSYGLGSSAIEMIAAASAPQYDLARFGSEVFRSSSRQADLMIVAGTVSIKMGPRLRLLWEQMPEPKWVPSMGQCANSGGEFYDRY